MFDCPRSAPGSMPTTAHRLARFLALVIVAPAALQATTVRELNFLALERAAGSVFHGRCLARREVTEGTPVPYIEYRFQILSAVKGCRDGNGKPVKFLTFRHVAPRRTFVRPDGTRAIPLRVALPTYRVGEEVVLFLTRESRIGLCSPVGLHQGKFSVLRAAGKASVRNALANVGLFKRVEARAFTPEAEAVFRKIQREPSRLELQSFLKLCRGVKR